MSEFHNQSRASARGSNYVWQYEYYDDEEPVSFEGLKAHRYSIVIGFWVGLAVFVIFMFFVLTLLTKTGAPHQENPDPAEKRHCPGSHLVEVPPDPTEKVFSRPLLPEANSFFHFYISEEEQVHGHRRVQRYHGKAEQQAHREDSKLRDLSSSGIEEAIEEGVGSERLQGHLQETDRETTLLSHFNIPNFVNSEQGSMLGEDDMLLCEPSVMPDGQFHFRDSHRAIN